MTGLHVACLSFGPSAARPPAPWVVFHNLRQVFLVAGKAWEKLRAAFFPREIDGSFAIVDLNDSSADVPNDDAGPTPRLGNTAGFSLDVNLSGRGPALPPCSALIDSACGGPSSDWYVDRIHSNVGLTNDDIESLRPPPPSYAGGFNPFQVARVYPIYGSCAPNTCPVPEVDVGDQSSGDR